LTLYKKYNILKVRNPTNQEVIEVVVKVKSGEAMVAHFKKRIGR